MVLLGANVTHLITFRLVFRYASIANSSAFIIVHVVILYFS